MRSSSFESKAHNLRCTKARQVIRDGHVGRIARGSSKPFATRIERIAKISNKFEEGIERARRGSRARQERIDGIGKRSISSRMQGRSWWDGKGTRTKRLPFLQQLRWTTSSSSVDGRNQPSSSHKRKRCTNITFLATVHFVRFSPCREAVCMTEGLFVHNGRLQARNSSCSVWKVLGKMPSLQILYIALLS